MPKVRLKRTWFSLKMTFFSPRIQIKFLSFISLACRRTKVRRIPKSNNKVAKCFESESALFWPEKRQNTPWIFFSKNATISVKGATIWEFFFENDWQYQFLLHFYVIIFSKYPKYNISQRFFNIFNWKISFWRFFLILLGAPNYFWRHKEFQKRHSGAKAPLLATLSNKELSSEPEETPELFDQVGGRAWELTLRETDLAPRPGWRLAPLKKTWSKLSQ